MFFIFGWFDCELLECFRSLVDVRHLVSFHQRLRVAFSSLRHVKCVTVSWMMLVFGFIFMGVCLIKTKGISFEFWLINSLCFILLVL